MNLKWNRLIDSDYVEKIGNSELIRDKDGEYRVNIGNSAWIRYRYSAFEVNWKWIRETDSTLKVDSRKRLWIIGEFAKKGIRKENRESKVYSGNW